MTKIKQVNLYKVYNGSGYPAVAVKLWLSNGQTVSAANALPWSKDYGQLFVSLLEKFQGQVEPFFKDLELGDDAALTADRWLLEWQAGDKFLAAVSFALSVAVNRVGALLGEKELYIQLSQVYGFDEAIYSFPTPLINLFNGGRHADTNLDFEEFLLVPLTKNKTSLNEKVSAAATIFGYLADGLRDSGLDSDLGSYGGYAPDMTSSIEAFKLIISACQKAGYDWGNDFGLGVNVGAQYLSAGHGNYLFQLERSNLQAAGLAHLYEEWERQYSLVYLEDPLANADLSGWKKITLSDNNNLILAGNHFFANSQVKFRQNLKNHLANAIVVKPSEMGAVGEAANLIKLAEEHQYQIIMSGGDQETNDSFLADFSLAVNAGFVKSGSVARGERNGKLNRLLEVEQDLAM